MVGHGAELGLMRDLYLAQTTSPCQPPATPVDAAARGYWAEVRTLVRAGGDVSATRPGDLERTALHYAAGAAPLDVVHLLVEHGADTSARDGEFDATPLQWAEFFGRLDVVEYLEELT